MKQLFFTSLGKFVSTCAQPGGLLSDGLHLSLKGHSCKIGNASDLTGYNTKFMLGMCSTHVCL